MFRELFAVAWGGRSMDRWAIATWDSARAFGHGGGKSLDGNRHEPLIIGFEVKVSRGDWKREMEQPDKREPAMRRCHAFYFAVPEGMVESGEVPEDCGLIYVSQRGEVRKVVAAKKRTIEPPTWQYVALLMRRLEMCELGHRQSLVAGTPYLEAGEAST